MGAGRVYAKQRDFVPPPGKYEIPSTLSKTAYTMRPRLEPSKYNFKEYRNWQFITWAWEILD